MVIFKSMRIPIGLFFCSYGVGFLAQTKSNGIEKVQQQHPVKEERALEEGRWDTLAYNLAQKYAKDHPSEFLQQAEDEDVTLYALLKAIQAEKEKTLLQISKDLEKASPVRVLYPPMVSGDENKKSAIIRALLDAYERLKEEQELELEVQAEMLEFAQVRRKNMVTREHPKVVYTQAIKRRASFLYHLYHEFMG